LTDIEQNVARVLGQIRAAAGDREVMLVAATKMNDAEAIQRAIRAGIHASGENRVQEMMEKLPQGAYEGAPLHFIGSLQKNKVKFVVGNCDLIHSVNSVSLLEAINKEAARQGIIQKVLLEVNVGNEESKSGFSADALPAILEQMANFSNVRVCGLMAIPPICEDSTQSIKFFQEMYNLSVDITAKKYDNVWVDVLSMGMSDDFREAIACGSTMIRVGTAIFGARDYDKIHL
jgi:pyridoxal phosphate enzyme (YggS family)